MDGDGDGREGVIGGGGVVFGMIRLVAGSDGGAAALD